MYAFIASALVWVATQFGHPGALPAPNVQFASEQRMLSAAAAADPRARDFFAAHRGTLGGLYLPDSDTIYLRRELDLDNPDHQAILVHELVHYVQDQLGGDGGVDELEAQAYGLQRRWRAEQGG